MADQQQKYDAVIARAKATLEQGAELRQRFNRGRDEFAGVLRANNVDLQKVDHFLATLPEHTRKDADAERQRIQNEIDQGREAALKELQDQTVQNAAPSTASPRRRGNRNMA